jgi:hypothetical protein
MNFEPEVFDIFESIGTFEQRFDYVKTVAHKSGQKVYVKSS